MWTDNVKEESFAKMLLKVLRGRMVQDYANTFQCGTSCYKIARKAAGTYLQANDDPARL